MSRVARIAGLGTALPPGVVDAARAAELMPRLIGLEGREARAFAALIARSGVERRRSVLVGADGEIALYPTDGGPEPGTAARMAAWREWAPELATSAARAALDDAGWRAGDVTDLVLVSCTGFAAPGVDVALIERLALPPTVARTHVGFMGCHGAINGLRVARGLVAARPGARVLLVAVELCTLHLARAGRPGHLVASALFADGAASLCIGDGDLALRGSELALCDTGSSLIEDSTALMGWDPGDRGFEMELSPGVPAAIEARLAAWLVPWLAARGLAVSDVGGWAVHPGGVRVLDAVERALALPAGELEPSRRLLAELGNMSSPTVLFLLDRLLRAGRRPPFLLLAFGPGLFAEAALLDAP